MNKLYTSINEFKRNALKPINEGLFSWYTQDTNTQIGSEPGNRITVYMFDNKGNVWKESSYKGYGVFGGKDYYELVAEMNGYTEGTEDELRQIGIDLSFNGLKTKNEDGITLYPALVTDEHYDINNHEFSTEADLDPDQGRDIDKEEEEGYDDDYYNWRKNSLNENNKPNAISAMVYRANALGDTTANGLSSKKDELLLFDPEGEYVSNRSIDQTDEDYLVLMRKSFRGKPYMYAVPKSILDEGVHSMFGGNFLYSSDSRFPEHPIKIHDRVER